ncbi:rhodanese-like domain-containing protein [Candidatus Gracilibacteria bacterium]|nr:rhodanese-like domain-containing protein [Candidatus Gracilibacteria bacterium]
MTIKRLESSDFKEVIKQEGVTLIDVRTKQEQDIFGVISENQTHIDIYKPEALDQIKKLPKEGRYLIYCYHGNRSQQIGNMMLELGFSDVSDLIGGIDEWKKLVG